MPDTMMPLTTPVDLRMPVTRRPRSAWAMPPVARRLGSTLVLLAVWQAGYAMGLISPRVLAPPSAHRAGGVDDHPGRHVAAQPAQSHLPASWSAWRSRWSWACRWRCSPALSRAGEDAVDAPLQMVRTLPHLALVPLFILWFGIGETPKIALVALGSLFPIYLNLVAAIRGVDPKLIEAGRTLGLSRVEMIRHVILPGALPGFLVGLRYAVGVAWLSLVVGEQINADSGIGYMMMDARDFLRTDIILVGLVTYALLGLLGDQGVRLIERRALAWRPGGR